MGRLWKEGSFMEGGVFHGFKEGSGLIGIRSEEGLREPGVGGDQGDQG